MDFDRAADGFNRVFSTAPVVLFFFPAKAGAYAAGADTTLISSPRASSSSFSGISLMLCP